MQLESTPLLRRLGKYRILAEIGRGGMGIVYLAEDTSLTRQVAIKVLSGHLAGDQVFIEGFRREAKTVATLSHPHIVRINAFDSIENQPVIEMEYVEGGSLAQKLRDEFVSTHDALRFGYDIAGALAYCHASGAIHRDIKPSNILVDTENRARLADFGIARAISGTDQLTRSQPTTDAFFGTPQYAPPEAWEGQVASPSWDCYSLGAVLFECVCGRPPYDCKSPLELARRLAVGPAPKVQETEGHVSAGFASLIERLVTPESKARVNTAEELMQNLEEVPEFSEVPAEHSLTIRTRPTVHGVVDRQAPEIQRSGWAALTVGGLIALSVLAASYFSINTGPRDGRSGVSPADTKGLSGIPAGVSPEGAIERVIDNPQHRLASTMQVFSANFVADLATTSQLWLVDLPASTSSGRIFAHAPGRIAVMECTLDESSGRFQVTGEFAGYTDQRGTVFHSGSIRGFLVANAPVLSGVLEYIDAVGGVAVPYSISAVASEVPVSQFIQDLEASPYVQPLLFNELRPRNADWSEIVYGLLPAINPGRLAVRKVERLPEIGEDGRLIATVWSDHGRNTGQTTELLGQSRGTGHPDARMPMGGFRYSEDTLYLRFESAVGHDRQDLVFDLHLLTDYAVPLQQSAVWTISYDSASGTSEVFRPEGIKAEPTEQVQFRSTELDGRWVVEGYLRNVDFSGAGVGLEAGQVWRANAVLSSVDDAASGSVLRRWGYPDETQLHHGILLEFLD